jgi:hypothetical protein
MIINKEWKQIILWKIIVIFGENENTMFHFHDLYPNLLVTPFFVLCALLM